MIGDAAEQSAIEQQERPGARTTPFIQRIPVHGWVGLAINLLAWTCSWTQFKPFSAYTFFPLWFGFILVLDGLNVARTGTSPLTRNVPRFIAMFLISAPLWWAFEALNIPVQNWHYVFDRPYSAIAYFLISSLDFSTVLPGVMEMAELLASVPALRPRLSPTDPGGKLSIPAAAALFGVGLVTVVLPTLFPRYAYGLIWLSLIFLLDPINNLFRRKSTFGHLLRGDWRFILTVPLAAISCGFFWEMWNYLALPKWYYTVPFFDAWPHLFEMPVPGYLGYLPFALEVFAMYQFVLLLTGGWKDNLVI
jgi:hypothetical protein